MFLIRARVLAQEGGDALLNDPVDRVVAYGMLGVMLCFDRDSVLHDGLPCTLIPSRSRRVNQRSKRLI